MRTRLETVLPAFPGEAQRRELRGGTAGRGGGRLQAVASAAPAMALLLALFLAAPLPLAAQEEELPTYLADRGTGVPLSMFGTYIEHGELIVYPFFEYYLDNDLEYQPDEFGSGVRDEFRGRYRASELLLLLAYGLTEDVALEIEAAWITAELRKSAEDFSALPGRIEESGFGDVEAQVRWRWMRESESRPELFSYFETVFPHAEDKPLIGTSDWELKLGLGVVRGFGFGTLTVRGAAEYAGDENKVEIGEYAVEYLRRLSPAWRVFLAVEGAQDEVELITELQWHLGPRAFVKLNNAFGLTSKATDWAPEVGVVFRF